MYCENCGNKILEGYKFCTKCGFSVVSGIHNDKSINEKLKNKDEKWWHRLLKVLYITSYMPLLIIIPIVWSENSCYYCSNGDSFWYSVLTLVIYIVIIRLIKIAVLYVTSGRRPEWRKEFKRFI